MLGYQSLTSSRQPNRHQGRIAIVSHWLLPKSRKGIRVAYLSPAIGYSLDAELASGHISHLIRALRWRISNGLDSANLRWPIIKTHQPLLRRLRWRNKRDHLLRGLRWSTKHKKCKSQPTHPTIQRGGHCVKHQSHIHILMPSMAS